MALLNESEEPAPLEQGILRLRQAYFTGKNFIAAGSCIFEISLKIWSKYMQAGRIIFYKNTQSDERY